MRILNYFKQINVEIERKSTLFISNPQFGNGWRIGEHKEVLSNTKIVFTLINTDENGKLINPADIGIRPDWLG